MARYVTLTPALLDIIMHDTMLTADTAFMQQLQATLLADKPGKNATPAENARYGNTAFRLGDTLSAEQSLLKATAQKPSGTYLPQQAPAAVKRHIVVRQSSRQRLYTRQRFATMAANHHKIRHVAPYHAPVAVFHRITNPIHLCIYSNKHTPLPCLSCNSVSCYFKHHHRYS